MSSEVETRIIQIEGLGYGGEGFARTESGRYISVPHTLCGDRVRVRVGEFRRGRAFAEVVEWLERSTDHVEPQCQHYQSCSGCALRHMSPTDERRFKLDAATQIMSRYGPPLASDTEFVWLAGGGRTGHRRRGRFRVETRDGRVLVGLRTLHVEGGLVDVRDCPAQTRRFQTLMTAVGRLLDRVTWVDSIEWVEIWTGEESSSNLVILSTKSEPCGALAADFLQLSVSHNASLGLIVADNALRMLAGKPAVALSLLSGRETVSVDAPWGSWTHATPLQADVMASWIANRVAEIRPSRLLDLCCGVGTLTFRLAPHVRSVIAVDEDRAALSALQDAAERAGLDHVKTRAGRVGVILRKLRRELSMDHRPDLVTINPMRRPLGIKQLRDLEPLAPRWIIYAGPSAVSAAKDCALIAELGYRVEHAAVVNLHPATAQLMLVLCLVKETA